MHIQIPFFDENNPNKKKELEFIRLAEHNFYDDHHFPIHKLHRLSVPVVTDRYLLFFLLKILNEFYLSKESKSEGTFKIIYIHNNNIIINKFWKYYIYVYNHIS